MVTLEVRHCSTEKLGNCYYATKYEIHSSYQLSGESVRGIFRSMRIQEGQETLFYPERRATPPNPLSYIYLVETRIDSSD